MQVVSILGVTKHLLIFQQVYYVLASNPDPYPPDFTDYINSVASTIGAEAEWTETNDDVYNNFAATGDWMRSSSPDLETVINAGVRLLHILSIILLIGNYLQVRTIIYDGDAVSFLLISKLPFTHCCLLGLHSQLQRCRSDGAFLRDTLTLREELSRALFIPR